jgi:superfamily II DNA or RNA helicase
MPWKCEQVHEVPLSAARSAEEYAIHRAALEWSLAEPIIIQRAEDIRSRVNWQDRLRPFAHQVQNQFTFCRRLPVTLLADDVGLGKTISAGLILSELMIRRRVSRTLVLCPKILAPQWEEELDAKFGITAKVAVGKDLDLEMSRQTPVVVTTYDSARERLRRMESGAFDMLILDEAHKLRNLHGTKSPPVMAVRAREALEQRLFKYVLMLTATPLQNRLWDLYSLLECMTVAKGHKNPLGDPQPFQRCFIQPKSQGRRLQPDRAKEFRDILREYMVRTRRENAQLKFPERRVRMCPVTLTAGEQRLAALVARYITGLNPLQQISLGQALMSSPLALASQMENMAQSGRLPAEAAREARAAANAIAQPAKMAGLLLLLRELRVAKPKDWRAVVFTMRRETQEMMGRILEQDGITYGYIRGGDAAGNQRALARFRLTEPQGHVLVSTDAGAEGINLQVANVLVNYDLPWNPMIVEQRIGRVQRLASRHEFVVVSNLVASGSVEERVVGRLMEKLQLIAHAVGDIEATLEATSPDDDSEVGSFENRIRDLVVKSLVGQDVTAAAELARRSIEQAKRQMEQQRHELEATLGRLDIPPEPGPAMPQLTRGAPSVPARDFVLRAKKAEGAAIQQLGAETYEALAPGRTKEIITFDEAAVLAAEGRGVFLGNPPRLYLPGKPAFERLTQHWVDRAGHHVRAVRASEATQAERLAREWCATVEGAEFRRAAFSEAQPCFQGRVVIKAKAANAVDGYEKLILGRTCPPGHEPCSPPDGSAPALADGLLPSEVYPPMKSAVARVVEADADIAKFCRFYEARLQEEAARAGDDPRKLHKVRSDFTPLVYAELVALEGMHYAAGSLDVWFALEGDHPYQVTLEAIPATGQLVKQPALAACGLTGRKVPKSCLAVCAITGKQALKHLLVTSEVSDRIALSEFAVTCPVSGRRLQSDEMARSALTGREAAATLFRPSPVSGRLGLLEDFARCEVTGAEVLHDELERSGVSNRLFRADEREKSAVSGIAGHRTEFVRCQQTGQPILPAEVGKSDFSGKLVRRDVLQQSAKAPGRWGLPDEFAVCAATGRQLLRDEVAQSAVSGHWFDRDLLRPSACSGSLAHPDEMVACEETGAVLLPSETARCTITGKRVDRRLLAQSQATEAIALPKFFVQCAKTKKWALPTELVECDLTRLKVLPGELEFCAATGRRVLRERLLKSAVSERYVLPEKAVRSLLTGAVGLPDEMISCAWLEGPILKVESGVCRLTGCTVARRFLNSNGELIALRQLLDGSADNPAEDFALAAWLAQGYPDSFRGLKRVWCLLSPHGGIVAACGEIPALLAFLGRKPRYAGFLVRLREPRAILGRHVMGHRTANGWIPDTAR